MNFLTDKTKPVFSELAGYNFIKQFTFVGGSAMAYYLNHRLSEDLDFFYWKSELPDNTDTFIKEFSRNKEVEFGNLSSVYIDLFINGTKITLFANDWQVLKDSRKNILGNIFAANLEVLCAMKVNVLSFRAKFRDYYDLYVLNKERYSIEEIYNHSVNYIPGMTKKIFGMQLSYIDDIEDENIKHLSPDTI
ncbi:MAG: nucleotidyl transferase AbiEii/AbiGii toxin family protein [Ignavibacteriales bacterium]|nr:MAG: nucleotidyl transferase AbiEii/AbiGii toxin family protein [Ignavibacteriales bacterium]